MPLNCHSFYCQNLIFLSFCVIFGHNSVHRAYFQLCIQRSLLMIPGCWAVVWRGNLGIPGIKPGLITWVKSLWAELSLQPLPIFLILWALKSLSTYNPYLNVLAKILGISFFLNMQIYFIMSMKFMIINEVKYISEEENSLLLQYKYVVTFNLLSKTWNVSLEKLRVVEQIGTLRTTRMCSDKESKIRTCKLHL